MERTIMKRIIASLAAAGVLVAGSFAAVALTSDPAVAQVAEDEATTEEKADRPNPVVDVLDELVADGTLDQGQADAVLSALEAKREELKEERGDKPRRGHRRGFVRGLLQDGVITADEIADLPDDHPLKDPDGPLADALSDGEITQEEWDAFVEERKAAADNG